VSVFYFWTYQPFHSSAGQAAKRETAALIFPRYKWLFGDISDALPPARLVYCVDNVTKSVLNQVGMSRVGVEFHRP
jgi:hypothetical protein